MERIIYDQMWKTDEEHLILNIHLHAYAFAHQYLRQKSVLDASCGTCFGTMIFSTVAKSITGVDKSRSAIEYGKKLPFFCPTKFIVRNLDRDRLPEADVCVCIETLEHLNGNGFFLRNLEVKQFVFSIPLNMASPHGYHKILFRDVNQVSNYLGSNGWRIVIGVKQERQAWVPIPNGIGQILHDEMLGVAERI